MAAGSDWLDSLDGRSSPPSSESTGEASPEEELAAHRAEGNTGSLSPQPDPAPHGASPITPAINQQQRASIQESVTPITPTGGQKHQVSALQYVDMHAFAKKLKPNDKAELAKFVAVSPSYISYQDLLLCDTYGRI
jgi:hypothetical protein